MRIRPPNSDFLLIAVLLVLTGFVFWPATEWITRQTLAYEQLRQSFFLLLFAAAVLWIDHRNNLHLEVAVSRKGVALLAGSFVLLSAGFLVHSPLVPLAALTIALAAFIHFLFGDKGFNLTLPWLAGFGAFLFFILLFHVADWPLRKLAGSYAAQMLTLMGYEVKIGAVLQSGATLLMSVNSRFYEVATECNGFGLMSSSFILALLLMVSRPIGIGWKVIALLLAFAVGFAFNILRIIGIVVLAPYFPGHYDFLHEAIGLSALFGGLLFLWWVLGGASNRPADDTPTEPSSPPAAEAPKV